VRVLALDTTTRNGSAALLAGEDVRAEVRRVAESHSSWVVAAIADLVRDAGWRLADVDAFAVAAGPGSFTGLRVGLATVQGLALAARRPCLGVTTLDALGFLGRGHADTVVALVDAYREEVFHGRYDREGRARGESRVGKLAQALEGLSGPVAFVGDAVPRYEAEIRRLYPEVLLPKVEPFLAVAVGRLALPRLRAGEGIAPGALRPVYLREADIRKPTP
jgi:tRNA threonylcarbamoyladenosine biosynthesis protein TsaB